MSSRDEVGNVTDGMHHRQQCPENASKLVKCKQVVKRDDESQRCPPALRQMS